jgi:putative ABC transport system ATP-binding protein
MEKIIDACSISKFYQSGGARIKAVDGVCLEAYAGQFIGLVGPSGSGKTTMLAMLAALLTPSEGHVLINGTNLSKMPEKERVAFRREMIGFTFQANNLVPFLTTRENVELMLRLNGRNNPENRRRAGDLLERLGLGARMNNLPSQLSGGEKQRVSIARSLIHNPSVVLADEPTAALDTERAYQVVSTFSELIHEQNKVGIMVTHDMRMCKDVDKIVQLKDGRVETVVEGKEEITKFLNVCG